MTAWPVSLPVPPVATGGADAISVLLVEDQPGDASLVQALLASSVTSFEVHHVETLAGALTVVADVDCVLLDLGLPDADGLEALDGLVAVLDHPAVVVLTGRSDRSLGVEATAHGATDYLSKDFLGTDLLENVIRRSMERNRVQRLLEHSEQRFREVVGALREAVLLFDEEYRIFAANPACEELTGWSADELMGRSLFDSDLRLADEEGTPLHLEHPHVLAAASGAGVLGAVMRLRHRSGETRWLDVNNVLIVPEGSGPPYMVASCRDVTAWRTLRQQLVRLSQLQATAAAVSREVLRQESPDGLVVAAARTMYDSPLFSVVTAWRIDAGGDQVTLLHRGRHWNDADDDAELARLVFEATEGAGPVADVDVPGLGPAVAIAISRAGGTYIVLLDDSADPDRPVLGQIANDLFLGLQSVDQAAQRREAEQAQRASEARFRTLLRHSRDTVVIVSANGTISYISPAVRQLTGHDPSELIGLPVTALLTGDERELALRRFESLLRREPDPRRYRYELRAVDGSKRLVEVSAVPLFDDPAIDGVMLDVHDVTEAVNRVEALRESEQRHRAIVDTAPSGILTVDAAGIITFANPQASDIIGLPVQDIVGKPPVELVSSEHQSAFRTSFRRLADGEAGDYELELHRHDGEVRWVHLRSRELHGADGVVTGALVMASDVTSRRRIEDRVRFQAELLDVVGEAVLATDVDGLIIYWNAAAGRLYGWSSDEVLGLPVVEITPSSATKAQAEHIMAAMRQGESWSGEFEVRRRNGTTFPALVSNSPIHDESGALIGMIGVSIDITDRVRGEEAMAQRAAQHEAIAAVGELAVSGTATAELFHAAVRRATEALHADVGELVLGERGSDVLRLAASAGIPDGAEGVRWTRDDRWLAGHVMAVNRPVVVDDITAEKRFGIPSFLVATGAISGVLVALRIQGGAVGVLGVFSRERRAFDDNDINVLQSIANVVAHALERDEAQKEIGRRAVTDELTGLANRALYLDRLDHALRRRSRREGDIAVLFADIDRFKDVNDALGHAAGDELLRGVCRVLVNEVRDQDTVARFGGDEFAILCEGLEGAEHAMALAARIVDGLGSTPIEVEGRVIHVSASMGVVVPDVDSPSPGAVLRDADSAMYRAKAAGGGRVELFDESLREQLVRRLDLINELRTAIHGDQLELHYQPEVDLATGELVWAEALVRWRHPERGLLQPDSFIGLAEETGLVVPLGNWVLETAVKQLVEWRSAPPGCVPTSVSVNVSARQLVEGDLVARTESLLDSSGIDPASLWFELTETALFRDPARGLAALHDLKALGVGLSIDDFGTGYSSLAYAQQLPVDALKIDRSFVSGIGSDLRDEGIVRAVIEMAHSFGILAIAEGVATVQQLDALRRYGCDLAQGYLLGRPGTAATIEAWTTRWHEQNIVRDRATRAERASPGGTPLSESSLS